MKKFAVLLLAFFSLSLTLSYTARAQKEPRQSVGCIDPTLRLQADAIKQHYIGQGFKVYRDAMINMESMVPFPIMVQLAQGHLYEIIFVGNPAATNHKMIMYDSNDRKVDEKFISRRHGDEASNYIIYEFVPERTDTYLFEFMTRLKNKEMCGSVCILAVDASKGQVKYTPYVP
jgi:hypothetical protein